MRPVVKDLAAAIQWQADYSAGLPESSRLPDHFLSEGRVLSRRVHGGGLIFVDLVEVQPEMRPTPKLRCFLSKQSIANQTRGADWSSSLDSVLSWFTAFGEICRILLVGTRICALLSHTSDARNANLHIQGVAPLTPFSDVFLKGYLTHMTRWPLRLYPCSISLRDLMVHHRESSTNSRSSRNGVSALTLSKEEVDVAISTQRSKQICRELAGKAVCRQGHQCLTPEERRAMRAVEQGLEPQPQESDDLFGSRPADSVRTLGSTGAQILIDYGVDPRNNLREMTADRVEFLERKKIPQIMWMLARVSDLLPAESKNAPLIVDVGGGRGDLAMAMAAVLEVEVWVVDVNEQSVEEGKRWATSQNRCGSGAGRIKFLVQDFRSVTFPEPYSRQTLFVGIHVCGGLADALLAKAVQIQASAVLVCCCFSKYPELRENSGMIEAILPLLSYCWSASSEDKSEAEPTLNELGAERVYSKIARLAESPVCDTRDAATMFIMLLRKSACVKLSTFQQPTVEILKFPSKYSPKNFVLKVVHVPLM